MIGLGLLVWGIYIGLLVVSCIYFILWMIPGCLAAFLLGRYKGAAVFSRWVLHERRSGTGFWEFLRANGWGWALAALLWDAVALALSVLLGCWNGWLILHVRRGRVLGGCLAALCFLLGYSGLPRFQKAEKEEKNKEA